MCLKSWFELDCAHAGEIDAYGDIRCSSRRVVGIAVERPLKPVAAATWRGTADRFASTKIGKIIITCVDSRPRPAARRIRREEEALSPQAHLKIPLTLPVPLSPEWPRPPHRRIPSRLLVITLWKPLPRRIGLCRIGIPARNWNFPQGKSRLLVERTLNCRENVIFPRTWPWLILLWSCCFAL